MRRKSRICDDDLVAWINQDMEEGVQSLHMARCDNYILIGIGVYSGLGKVRSGHSFAQFRQPIWQRILSDIHVTLEGLCDPFPYIFGCTERWQSPGKRHRPFSLRTKHRHLLDRRNLHFRDVTRYQTAGFQHLGSPIQRKIFRPCPCKAIGRRTTTP